MWIFKRFTSQPYTLGEEVASLSDDPTIKLYKGTKNSDNSAVSIFTYDTSDSLASELGSNAQKQAKTLIFPIIPKYMDTYQSGRSICIVTEVLEPFKPEEFTNNELTWALHSIGEFVKFMGDNQIIHGNLVLQSLFQTSGHEIRVAGLHWLSQRESGPLQNHRGEWIAKLGLSQDTLPKNVDLYILHRTFNGMIDRFPRPLQGAIKAWEKPDPHGIHPFLKHKYWDTDKFSSILIGLQMMFIQNGNDQDLFFRDLARNLNLFSTEMQAKTILPKLIDAITFVPAEAIVSPILEIMSHVSGDSTHDFAPVVMSLLMRKERSIRINILQRMDVIITLFDAKVLNDTVFPQLVGGLSDTSVQLRQATLISMVSLAKKLNSNNMLALIREIRKLQQDPDPSIRTNVVVCLSKISPSIDFDVREQLLMTCFAKAASDASPGCRKAAISAFKVCLPYFTVNAIANTVLPAISPLLVDSSYDVTSTAFNSLDAILKPLKDRYKELEEELPPEEEQKTTTPELSPRINSNIKEREEEINREEEEDAFNWDDIDTKHDEKDTPPKKQTIKPIRKPRSKQETESEEDLFDWGDVEVEEKPKTQPKAINKPILTKKTVNSSIGNLKPAINKKPNLQTKKPAPITRKSIQKEETESDEELFDWGDVEVEEKPKPQAKKPVVSSKQPEAKKESESDGDFVDWGDVEAEEEKPKPPQRNPQVKREPFKPKIKKQEVEEEEDLFDWGDIEEEKKEEAPQIKKPIQKVNAIPNKKTEEKKPVITKPTLIHHQAPPVKTTENIQKDQPESEDEFVDWGDIDLVACDPTTEQQTPGKNESEDDDFVEWDDVEAEDEETHLPTAKLMPKEEDTIPDMQSEPPKPKESENVIDNDEDFVDWDEIDEGEENEIKLDDKETQKKSKGEEDYPDWDDLDVIEDPKAPETNGNSLQSQEMPTENEPEIQTEGEMNQEMEEQDQIQITELEIAPATTQSTNLEEEAVKEEKSDEEIDWSHLDELEIDKADDVPESVQASNQEIEDEDVYWDLLEEDEELNQSAGKDVTKESVASPIADEVVKDQQEDEEQGKFEPSNDGLQTVEQKEEVQQDNDDSDMVNWDELEEEKEVFDEEPKAEAQVLEEKEKEEEKEEENRADDLQEDVKKIPIEEDMDNQGHNPEGLEEEEISAEQELSKQREEEDMDLLDWDDVEEEKEVIEQPQSHTETQFQEEQKQEDLETADWDDIDEEKETVGKQMEEHKTDETTQPQKEEDGDNISLDNLEDIEEEEVEEMPITGKEEFQVKDGEGSDLLDWDDIEETGEKDDEVPSPADQKLKDDEEKKAVKETIQETEKQPPKIEENIGSDGFDWDDIEEEAENEGVTPVTSSTKSEFRQTAPKTSSPPTKKEDKEEDSDILDWEEIEEEPTKPQIQAPKAQVQSKVESEDDLLDWDDIEEEKEVKPAPKTSAQKSSNPTSLISRPKKKEESKDDDEEMMDWDDVEEEKPKAQIKSFPVKVTPTVVKKTPVKIAKSPKTTKVKDTPTKTIKTVRKPASPAKPATRKVQEESDDGWGDIDFDDFE